MAYKIPVPYLTQLDNLNNPYGSCNVTAVAMVLGFYRIPIFQNRQQLEDILYQWLIDRRMSRHSPYDLSELLKTYRPHSTFTEKAKWGDVKRHLEGGNPIILHGWFTRFGHIVVLVGFNEQGYLVHDPYGKWSRDGYDLDAISEFLCYSYQDLIDLCGPDNDLWAHFCR